MACSGRRGEEQNREEGEMAQTKLGGGRKKKLNFREESREKGDLPPCSTPLWQGW